MTFLCFPIHPRWRCRDLNEVPATLPSPSWSTTSPQTSSKNKIFLLEVASSQVFVHNHRKKQLITLSRRIHLFPVHSAHMSLNSLGKLVHRTRGSLPNSFFTEGAPNSSSASHLPCCSTHHESQKVIMLEVQTFNSTRLNRVKRQWHNKDYVHDITQFPRFLACHLCCLHCLSPLFPCLSNSYSASLFNSCVSFLHDAFISLQLSENPKLWVILMICSNLSVQG